MSVVEIDDRGRMTVPKKLGLRKSKDTEEKPKTKVKKAAKPKKEESEEKKSP